MDGSRGDIFDNAKSKDTTAAERARRYRARKRAERDANRDGTVLRQQDGVEFEVSHSGDLTLFQGADRENHIFIAVEYLDSFLEGLEDIDASPQSDAPSAEAVTETVTPASSSVQYRGRALSAPPIARPHPFSGQRKAPPARQGNSRGIHASWVEAFLSKHG